MAEGQILMKQGDYSTELIGIQEGTADVIRDGKKIASLKQGDLIGEMGLLQHEPRNADVIATSPMRVMKLTHWEIRRMSEETLGPDQGDRREAAPGRRGRSGALTSGRLDPSDDTVSPPRLPLRTPAGTFELGEGAGGPWLMGIVNATPDSFSDGGAAPDAGRARRAHRGRCSQAGADMIDIGGESGVTNQPAGRRPSTRSSGWCR